MEPDFKAFLAGYRWAQTRGRDETVTEAQIRELYWRWRARKAGW